MLSRLGEHITEVNKNNLFRNIVLFTVFFVSQEDVKEMIEEADCLDNDGKVSYEEFKAILYSK